VPHDLRLRKNKIVCCYLSVIYNITDEACHKIPEWEVKDILQPTGEYSPSPALDSTHSGDDIFLLTP
jgi:hypothetical protein